MDNLVIKDCRTKDLSTDKNFEALCKEYAEESTIKGLQHFKVGEEFYTALEEAKKLRCIGAYVEGELVGFSVFLIAFLPHHSAWCVILDALFVAMKHRNSTIGLKLMKATEQFAKELGIFGVFYSAHVGSPLDKILEAKNYDFVTKIYYKRICDGQEFKENN